MITIDFDELLAQHNLPDDAMVQSGMSQQGLQEICDDHVEHTPELEALGQLLASELQRVPKVHSLKYRVKDPRHLVVKIIRKRLSGFLPQITVQNYKDEITDLLGIRVLHLFKDDWPSIHEFITNTWSLKEPPTANCRAGDPPDWIALLKERDCVIHEHDAGYRSVHYLIQPQVQDRTQSVEVQVRTIFEEGWSEVDHLIRYPDDVDNPILAPLLLIFNRFAGSADELASYIRDLKDCMEQQSQAYRKETADHVIKLGELKRKIDDLDIGTGQKLEIKNDIDVIDRHMVPQAERDAISNSLKATEARDSYPSLVRTFQEWTALRHQMEQVMREQMQFDKQMKQSQGTVRPGKRPTLDEHA